MANAVLTTAPLGAISVLRFVDLVLKAKDTVSLWNEARLTRKALAQLSDRELEDIGLTRAQALTF